MKYFGCVHIDIDTDLEAEDYGKDWDGICARIPGGFSVRIREGEKEAWDLAEEMLKARIEALKCVPKEKL